MSRSTTMVEKPFTKTLKFKNEKFDKKKKEVTQEAGFYYYKKSEKEGEEGENILVPMPLRFMWLETGQSVTGFNKKEEKAVYSNEILPLHKSYDKTLRVKVGDTEKVRGTWKEIKEKVADLGGKYCAPMYVAMDLGTGDGYEIVRILLSGGSRELAFEDRNKLINKAVEFVGVEEVDMPTGDTFQKPIYKFSDPTQEEIIIADKLVTKVDAYFEYIFSEDGQKSIATAPPTLEEADPENATY